jgi:hypothetical protein
MENTATTLLLLCVATYLPVLLADQQETHCYLCVAMETRHNILCALLRPPSWEKWFERKLVTRVLAAPSGGAHGAEHGGELTWGREDTLPQPGLQEAVHRILLQGVGARQHSLGTKVKHQVAASADRQV